MEVNVMKKKNPTTRKVVLEAMHRYIASEKGKSVRARWKEKNKEKMAAYFKLYHKARRDYCRVHNICIKCQKQPVVEGFCQCQLCIDKERLFYRNSKKPRKIIQSHKNLLKAIGKL